MDDWDAIGSSVAATKLIHTMMGAGRPSFVCSSQPLRTRFKWCICRKRRAFGHATVKVIHILNDIAHHDAVRSEAHSLRCLD